MQEIQEDSTATPEIVWAALRDLTESQRETDKQIKELRNSIKEVNQMIGGMGNSNIKRL